MEVTKMVLILVFLVQWHKALIGASMEKTEENRINNFTHFIVSGYRLNDSRFPKYAVSVQYSTSIRYFGDNHFCGGVIYKKNVILTAAHCVITEIGRPISPYDIIVVASTPKRLQRTSKTQIMSVKKIIAHKKFKHSTKQYDIAKLILRKSLRLDNTTAAALPLIDHSPMRDVKATVVGWGRLFNGGPMPSEILHADLYLWSPDDCRRIFRIHSSTLCASSKGFDRVDSCQGDSGGPLICEDKLCGLVSFGFICGIPGLPGFYTNVWYLREWIMSKSSELNSLSLMCFSSVVIVFLYV